MVKRNYRKRRRSADEVDDQGEGQNEGKAGLKAQIDDVKEIQYLRKRPSGLSVLELALGKEIPKEVEMLSDPLKLKTGGIIDLRKVKKSDLKNIDIEEGIRKTFSKESHLRDEDEEMRKYVEEELTKLRGGQPQEETEAEKAISIDHVLCELPNYLTKYHSRKTEDMLSNQMLCGIPEVDLGLEAKIKNIEETEAAKMKLLKEAMQKKKTVEETITARENVLKDLAKGYVQHAIFDIDGAINSGTDLIKRLDGCGSDEGISVSTSKFEVSDEYPPPPCPATNWPAAASALKPTDSECLNRFKEKFTQHN